MAHSPLPISRTQRRYQNALLFKQNTKKIFDTFTIKQNAKKIFDTFTVKQNAKKIFDTFTIKQNAEKVSETKKEHWCDVFNFKQNVEKIFDNFTLLTERGESTGDEEGGPTAYFPVRRGPPDEVYDALYEFWSYVEVLLMKYMMPYTL